VTNSVGCSITTTATITESSPMSLSLIGTNPSTSGASDGKIDAVITGGTEPYKYLWTGSVPLTPNDSIAIIHLKFGKYFLIVTDKNNCSKNGSYTLFDPPHAGDDDTTTIQDTPVPIYVLRNDNDADGKIDPTTVDLDPFSAGIQKTLVVDKKGVFSVTPDGVVTFRPLPNYYTSDPANPVAIQYVVQDNDGLFSNVANITVTVKSSNLPPKAVNDTITIPEHNKAIGNVIANDSDAENQPLVIKSFTVGSITYTPGATATIANVGSIIVNLNGSFTFTPLEYYFGSVPPVGYTIKDVEGLTASATLYIIVTPVKDPPIAVDDNFTGKENNIVEGNVWNPNPTSPDTDPKGLTITTDTIPIQSPTHGKVVLSQNGDFTYQPVIDFIGTDSFIYQICNSNTPSLCATATVTIVIAKDDSCKVFVPNVFTPNGDGIHDYFKVRCLYNYDNPEMQIYNRNGNLIFKKNHYGNTDFWGSEDQAFWNGRSQNKMNVINDELPVGTYYYILKLGNGTVLTGFIFLAK